MLVKLKIIVNRENVINTCEAFPKTDCEPTDGQNKVELSEFKCETSFESNKNEYRY